MKTGLFFGSFNPIHVGHLVIAEYIAENSDLKEIWFIVSPHNPFKKKDSLLANTHRLAMVKLAVEHNPKLKASDVEFALPQPSYTINTIIHLNEKYPNKEFALIMGSDNLQSFTKWKNYEELLNRCSLYVYPRPGFDGGELKNHPKVIWVDAPRMDISATYIRQAVHDGKSIRYMLTDTVFNYLTDMNFYRK